MWNAHTFDLWFKVVGNPVTLCTNRGINDPTKGGTLPPQGGLVGRILGAARGAGSTTTSAPTGISIARHPGTSTTTRGAGDRSIAGDWFSASCDVR